MQYHLLLQIYYTRVVHVVYSVQWLLLSPKTTVCTDVHSYISLAFEQSYNEVTSRILSRVLGSFHWSWCLLCPAYPLSLTSDIYLYSDHFCSCTFSRMLCSYNHTILGFLKTLLSFYSTWLWFFYFILLTWLITFQHWIVFHVRYDSLFIHLFTKVILVTSRFWQHG